MPWKVKKATELSLCLIIAIPLSFILYYILISELPHINGRQIMFVKNKESSAVNMNHVITIKKEHMTKDDKYIIMFFYAMGGNSIWLYNTEAARDIAYDKLCKLIDVEDF